MNHTIHVDHVLQEEIRTPYCDLVTRPTGAAVRNRIRAVIAETKCRTAFLDFSSIGLLDFSCADEIVAKLLRDPHPEWPDYVVLRGLNEAHRDAIHHVLENQALAILAVMRVGGYPAILGHVAPDAHIVFDRVVDLAPVTAYRLATSLEWPVERTREMLDALAIRRLVREEAGLYTPPGAS